MPNENTDEVNALEYLMNQYCTLYFRHTVQRAKTYNRILIRVNDFILHMYLTPHTFSLSDCNVIHMTRIFSSVFLPHLLPLRTQKTNNNMAGQDELTSDMIHESIFISRRN